MPLFSLKNLNEAAGRVNGYISFDTLEVGKPYKILGFDSYESAKYKKDRVAVRVNIEGGYLILPEHFDQDLNAMKEMDTSKLFIIFNGRDGTGNRLKIKFEEK